MIPAEIDLLDCADKAIFTRGFVKEEVAWDNQFA